MSIHSINCLGCGDAVSGEFKLCLRCCQLLDVEKPSCESENRENTSNLDLATKADNLTRPNDKFFMASFLYLSFSATIILACLATTILNPFEPHQLRLLMDCLC